MLETIPYVGEWMALLNAVLWAVSMVLFKISGHHIQPFTLNFFKNTIGSFFLILTLVFMGQAFFIEAPLRDYILLIISGIIGIGIADTLLFQSLNLLGASRSAIVDCLYAPMIMICSFIFLQEPITAAKIVGGFLVILSIPLIYSDRKKEPIASNIFFKGLILGAASMGLMSLSVVVIKPQLEIYPLMWTTSIRMVAGTLLLVVIGLIRSDRKRIFGIFKPQPVWKIAFFPSFLGAYPCIILWIGSFKYAKASVAGIITQLSVFFTVILAGVFLKEPLTTKKWLALGLAICGSLLVTLNQ